MTESHATKPHLPPTAVVWTVRRSRNVTRQNLTRLCREQWGAHYYVTPTRVAHHLARCIAKGWLTAAPGKWATVREAPGTRFDTEHDPTLLAGHRHLHDTAADTMMAWRRHHPEATR